MNAMKKNGTVSEFLKTSPKDVMATTATSTNKTLIKSLLLIYKLARILYLTKYNQLISALMDLMSHLINKKV